MRLPIGLRYHLKLFALVMVLGPLGLILLLLVPVWLTVRAEELPLDFFFELMLHYLGNTVFATTGLSMFVYGLVRGGMFHPALTAKYRQWLATTPWTPRHPLPNGPVHLVWIDYLIVVVACGLTRWSARFVEGATSYLADIYPAIVFAVALTITWSAVNWHTSQTPWLYAMVAVPLVVGLFRPPVEYFWICLVLMAGLAWCGVRQSLREFPGEVQEAGNRSKQIILAWPYETLMTEPKAVRLPWLKAAIQATFCGGYVWLVLDFIARNAEPDSSLAGLDLLVKIVPAICFIGAIIRLLAYAPVLCSKFCYGRRHALDQWIIPEHDRIFLAPLLMTVLGCVLPPLLYLVGSLSIPLTCAVTITVVYFVGRTAGPSMRELWLTGVQSYQSDVLGQNDKDFLTTAGQKA